MKKLEAAGDLRIEGDPADGRSYLIHTTEQGSLRLERFRDDLITRYAPVLTDWDAADLATLVTLLSRLNADMATALARRSDQAVVKQRAWEQRNRRG